LFGFSEVDGALDNSESVHQGSKIAVPRSFAITEKTSSNLSLRSSIIQARGRIAFWVKVVVTTANGTKTTSTPKPEHVRSLAVSGHDGSAR
jgi:hypothetical protein